MLHTALLRCLLVTLDGKNVFDSIKYNKILDALKQNLYATEYLLRILGNMWTIKSLKLILNSKLIIMIDFYWTTAMQEAPPCAHYHAESVCVAQVQQSGLLRITPFYRTAFDVARW